jgi:hypothetical protein
MATGSAQGRAGEVAFIVVGLKEKLRLYSQASPAFNKEIRIAAQEVAEGLLVKIKARANAIPAHGRNTAGRSQAATVVNGLKARRDRVPVIKLDKNKLYPSISRPNAQRVRNSTRGVEARVRMGHVFFGAEFGGGRRATTKQFTDHLGRTGRFFWPTIRDNRSFIITQYLEVLDNVAKSIEGRNKF